MREKVARGKPLTAQTAATCSYRTTHSGRQAWELQAPSLTPAASSAGGALLRTPALLPRLIPSQASPGAFREGTCPRVGSQEQDLELPALHETLKGRPLDLTPALCRGREKGGLSCPRPSMGASPLPPLAFVESKLRIKASPGASWAWAQLRQDRVFQCLEPKGKY